MIEALVNVLVRGLYFGIGPLFITTKNAIYPLFVDRLLVF